MEKQYHSKVWQTSQGEVTIDGPVAPDVLRTYRLDEGLTAFREPEDQHEALVDIAGLKEGRIIVARQDDLVIGYVTFLYPDPYERWSEGNDPYILELGAIEVSPRFRGQRIGKQLLEVSMMDPHMNDFLILTTEYYWHWDLKGSGLSIWDYRKVMEKMMNHGGLVFFPTDDPEIASHPANCLMARIGKHVRQETIDHFDSLRLRRRFMYD
ncbi:GNAT family N-acetyltransferase [Exiguobacterium sp. TRN 1102]|uniref:GNAT family N-acetyltransferase n=1 Tax=Exiguobacterium sp. TRN 1102 TaxID=3420732 RepID=UPI003D786CA4